MYQSSAIFKTHFPKTCMKGIKTSVNQFTGLIADTKQSFNAKISRDTVNNREGRQLD